MRKIIVLSMITIDGVMEAPGGPEEDPSGDLNMEGGWLRLVMRNMARSCRNR